MLTVAAPLLSEAAGIYLLGGVLFSLRRVIVDVRVVVQLRRSFESWRKLGGTQKDEAVE